jgi:hypothetical protein
MKVVLRGLGVPVLKERRLTFRRLDSARSGRFSGAARLPLRVVFAVELQRCWHALPEVIRKGPFRGWSAP